MKLNHSHVLASLQLTLDTGTAIPIPNVDKLRLSIIESDWNSAEMLECLTLLTECEEITWNHLASEDS